MNKTDLISVVSCKTELSKANTKKVVEAFMEAVAEALQREGKVTIAGFGTFSVVDRCMRVGINPRTKQVIEIPAHKSVKFKAGADLTNSVQ